MNDKEICEQFAQWLERKIFNELDLEGAEMNRYAEEIVFIGDMENLKRFTACNSNGRTLFAYKTFEEKEIALKVAKGLNGENYETHSEVHRIIGAEVICPKCRQKYKTLFNYCPMCGDKLDGVVLTF